MARDAVPAATIARAFRHLALSAPVRKKLRALTGDDQNDPSQVFEVPMGGGAFVIVMMDGSKYRVTVAPER